MIRAIRVYDSRGKSTIKTYLKVKNIILSAIAPSGKSTGVHEVKEYSSTIEGTLDFFSKNQKKIQDAFESDYTQEEFDKFLKELDSTEDFSNMGGTLSVALSMLYLRYLAFRDGKEVYNYLNPDAKLSDLPTPLGNVLGGGVHSNNILPVQEILVAHEDNDYAKRVQKNIDVYHEMESLLKVRNSFFAKNDEGAISINIDFESALKLVQEASYNLGYNTKLGLDIAANSFYKEGNYIFESKVYTPEEFREYLIGITQKFDNFLYIEDPFEEEDFESFAELQSEVSAMICGDDLYTTNTQRIEKGVKLQSTKAVLIKPNQIGTISDTKRAILYSKENGMTPVISHRSGESSDSMIAHLAVGYKIPYIKTGTVSGERVAKLNELLYIEEEVKRNNNQ